jgi:UDP-N-acetylmuramoyl-L-alanyl-D-glutamate--2,6-diaminopimelate ligase
MVDQISDVAFVTTDNPRTEEPEQIIEEVVSGMTPGNYKVIEDRREAIRAAIDMAGARDIVLIAGKGHEDYQEINGTRNAFDDRKVARQYIAATVEDRDARAREIQNEEEGGPTFR